MSKKPFDPLGDNVDVRKLLKSLYFAEEDYQTANLEQPSLMLSVARYRILMMRERMRVEAATELLKARMAHKYRGTTVNGKPRTESAIKEKVGMNKEVYSQQRELNEAIIGEELSKQLFEVFKQRQVAINNIIKARSNDIARDLWALDKGASQEKLKEAARVLRGKLNKHKESEE